MQLRCLIVAMLVLGNGALFAAHSNKHEERPSAFGDSQGELVLWKRAFAARMSRGRLLKQFGPSVVRRTDFQNESKNELICLAYSPNGRYCVAGGRHYGEVCVVDVNKSVVRQFQATGISVGGALASKEAICALALHPYDRQLVACDARGRNFILNFDEDLLAAGQNFTQLRMTNCYVQNVVAYSPNGQYIAVSDNSQGQGKSYIRILRSADQTVCTSLTGDHPFTGVAYNRAGNRLVTDNAARELQMWDSAIEQDKPTPLWSVSWLEGSGNFGNLSFSSHDDKVVKSDLCTHKVWLFDAATGSNAHGFGKTPEDEKSTYYPPYCLDNADNADESMIIGGKDGVVTVVDLATNAEKPLKIHDAAINSCVCMDDGAFVTSSEDCTIRFSNGKQSCVLLDDSARHFGVKSLVRNPANPNQVAALIHDTVCVLDIPDYFDLLKMERAEWDKAAEPNIAAELPGAAAAQEAPVDKVPSVVVQENIKRQQRRKCIVS